MNRIAESHHNSIVDEIWVVLSFPKKSSEQKVCVPVSMIDFYVIDHLLLRWWWFGTTCGQLLCRHVLCDAKINVFFDERTMNLGITLGHGTAFLPSQKETEFHRMRFRRAWLYVVWNDVGVPTTVVLAMSSPIDDDRSEQNNIEFVVTSTYWYWWTMNCQMTKG